MERDTNFKIKLDSLDIALLPLNKLLQNATDDKPKPIFHYGNYCRNMRSLDIQLQNEYCEFELVVKSTDCQNDSVEDHKEIFMESTTCYICNIDVPSIYLLDHYNSTEHNIFLDIAKIAVDKVKKEITQQFNESTLPETYSDATLYCADCNILIHNSDVVHHEQSKKHRDSIQQKSLLSEFLKIFNRATLKNNGVEEALDATETKSQIEDEYLPRIQQKENNLLSTVNITNYKNEQSNNNMVVNVERDLVFESGMGGDNLSAKFKNFAIKPKEKNSECNSNVECYNFKPKSLEVENSGMGSQKICLDQSTLKNSYLQSNFQVCIENVTKEVTKQNLNPTVNDEANQIDYNQINCSVCFDVMLQYALKDLQNHISSFQNIETKLVDRFDEKYPTTEKELKFNNTKTKMNLINKSIKHADLIEVIKQHISQYYNKTEGNTNTENKQTVIPPSNKNVKYNNVDTMVASGKNAKDHNNFNNGTGYLPHLPQVKGKNHKAIDYQKSDVNANKKKVNTQKEELSEYYNETVKHVTNKNVRPNQKAPNTLGVNTKSVTKNTLDAGTSKNKDFCNVCNVNTGFGNLEQHIKGRNHQEAVENSIVIKPDVGGRNFCDICNVDIPNCAKNIKEHYAGARHNESFTNYIKSNNIEKRDGTQKYFCKACTSEFSAAYLRTHVKSMKHKSNLVKLNPVDDSAKNKVSKLNANFCYVCKVPVSMNNMKIHVNGKSHRRNMKISTT